MSAGTLQTDGRREAVAAWVALTAPGALVTSGSIMLALLVVSALTPLVVVPRGVQQAAAILLLAHAGATAVLVLNGGRRWAAALFLGMLALDGFLSGVLLAGPGDQLALLLACAVLVLSLEVGGFFSAGMVAAVTALGALTAVQWRIRATVFSYGDASFSTLLSIETSFAGAAVRPGPVGFLPTQLSVEMSMGGRPAFASAAELFMPACALVLLAICLGLATNAWRVRRARAAVAASIVAAARVTAFVAVVVTLLLAESAASAECLPSGREAFAAGLDALNRGDRQTAFARFEELVKEQPDCAEARNNLAVVLFEMGLPEEADKQLRQAVELNPDYRRARANLRLVEASFRGQATKPEIENTVPGEAADQPTPGVTAVPATISTSETPLPEAAPVPAVPPNLAALEPEGTTACVLDVPRKQLCTFHATPRGIVQDACYPVLTSRVKAWPQWVIASDLTAQRVRLVDDLRHRRLRVVPGSTEMDESVTIRRQDFEALAKKVVPWRTGWVVLGPDTSPVSTAAAAQALHQVRAALEQWRQVWEGKKFDAYVGCYSTSFAPQTEGDVARWRARKQALFQQGGTLTVTVASPSVFVLGDGSSVITVFDQTYRFGALESHDVKALRWQRQGERWLISGETTLGESARPARASRPRGG